MKLATHLQCNLILHNSRIEPHSIALYDAANEQMRLISGRWARRDVLRGHIKEEVGQERTHTSIFRNPRLLNRGDPQLTGDVRACWIPDEACIKIRAQLEEAVVRA